MDMNINSTYGKQMQNTAFQKAYSNKNVLKNNAAKKKEKIENTADISKKNEENLSAKAQDFLKTLREKYGDYDFFVGNTDEEFDALSDLGNKEYSVIVSNEELERMAADDDYANEKMQQVTSAIDMMKEALEKEDGTTINKLSVVIDNDGNMKFFAELEKSADKQRENIEKQKEKKAEEKKAEEKKAEDKKLQKMNSYKKENKDLVKRTKVEADSIEELFEKIKNVDWDNISAVKPGDKFDFSV